MHSLKPPSAPITLRVFAIHTVPVGGETFKNGRWYKLVKKYTTKYLVSDTLVWVLRPLSILLRNPCSVARAWMAQ